MVRRNPNSKLAERASREAERGTPVEKGDYSAFKNGGSIGVHLSAEWCQYHGIDETADLNEWVDYESGAIIILPVESGSNGQ